ncbi:phosphatidate cytidylyltransferase [Pectinatus sottacetonis]|uniref:phosphatidate cytidylyltransferase n=1 Tax=Pectinatus sottacetonis TaxID=1002795 RepID=UPI0018C48CB9|nr:phosphatidate cytidylyltransferase [Pectinatus sottacetonis]
MLIRIVSGVIGIVAAFFIIMSGGFLFMLSAVLLAVIGWQEYVRAFKNKQMNISLWLGMICVAVLTLSGIVTIDNKPVSFFMPVMTFIVAVFMIKMVICHKKFSPIEAYTGLTGVLYIGMGFYYIVQLRLGIADTMTAPHGLSLGCALLWIALIGTWSSDTFAYFSGSFLGKNKLCPQISPKKTIEGFIGGVLGTIFTVTITGWYFDFVLWPMALLGMMLAVVATLGDLVESIFKRYTGIKDSGKIIPGHGGVLDRFDSILFTAPFVYYFYIFCHSYFIH